MSDSCLSIHQNGSSARSMSPDSFLSISWILCKIHVSGFMSQHLYISGSSARSMSPDPCLSIHMYLRILCKTHVSDSCLSIHQYGSSTRSMSSDSCLSIFVSQDPLQDPCLRIHVSAPIFLRILCKIHVSRSMSPIRVLASAKMHPLQDPCVRLMSQHLCISGSSARSMYSDSCLSIFVSHGFSARSMSPDPCLSIPFSGSSARSMSPDSCLSIFVSQDPLQDSCLRVSVSASSYLRILYKIHVSRSMCPTHVLASTNMDPLQDPCLRIHVSASLYLMESLHDPCLRIHVSASLYLRILYKIHVSGSMCPIHVLASTNNARSMSPDPCVRFMS